MAGAGQVVRSTSGRIPIEANSEEAPGAVRTSGHRSWRGRFGPSWVDQAGIAASSGCGGFGTAWAAGSQKHRPVAIAPGLPRVARLVGISLVPAYLALAQQSDALLCGDGAAVIKPLSLC